MSARHVLLTLAGGITAVVLAACSSTPSGPQVASAGGGGASTTTAAAPQDAAQAWHQWGACMRQHGAQVSDPTLNPQGTVQFDKDTLAAVTGQTMTSASDACKSIIANVQGNPASKSSGNLQGNLAVARCMRAHGVPDFPDPDPTTGGFQLGRAMANEPAFGPAWKACESAGSGNH